DVYKRQRLVRGGGTALPPPAYSNAVVFAREASVVISNTVIEEAHGDGCAFMGGEVVFVENVSPSRLPGYGCYAGAALYGGGRQATVWRSAGNVLTGGVRGGVWVEGEFSAGLDVSLRDGDILHIGELRVSNAWWVIREGTRVGVNDFAPGCVTMKGGSLLRCEGSADAPVVWSNYYKVNPWPGIRWLPGSTGILTHVQISCAVKHCVSNGHVEARNVVFTGLHTGYELSERASFVGERVVFQGMVNSGVRVLSGSRLYLRQSLFYGNNAPYIASVENDEKSSVDARFCWWNAKDGPYPFGKYGNETVTTNAGSVYFPWLLAAPGTQTNPPEVRITAPAVEPYETSEAQVWLEGTVVDDGQIVSVVVQNAASPQRVQVVPGVDGQWRGQIWLYRGMNALAVYAYDEQGNVSVDARLVKCVGAGVGQGSRRPLSMAPMPNRTVRVGELVRVRCVATSPDSCVITYWAEGVPAGGVFDQELRELRFVAAQAGVAHAITFYACDGKNVVKTTMIVDVVAKDPPVSILTKALPRGYRLYPYTYRLIADHAVGPVTWTFGDVKLPDGLVISRAGVISGVPLRHGTVSIRAVAQDTRQGPAATNVYTLEILNDMPTNGIYIPFQQLPICLSGTTYRSLATLVATNGLAPYQWYDASDVLGEIGMTMESNGMVWGTPTVAGVHGWVPVVRDQSNGTAYAELALPVVAPQYQLQRMVGLCKGKLLINRVPGSQHKGSIVLKFYFTPPAGFTFSQKSPAVAQLGLTQITVPNAYKYVPGLQLVFKKREGLKSTSITIKNAPGVVRASFAVKGVNLNYDFAAFGLENKSGAGTVRIPIWVRIGDYEMATELMPLQYVTMANKVTKGKAVW
ncbi:MAG: hypothetical protein N2595_00495, partial [bacterium]|nr:hypothetical protein [bacterium]